MLTLRFGVVLVFAVMGWWRVVLAAPSPPLPPAALSIVPSEGSVLLSVTARDVPLRTLLADIAQQVGFAVTGMGAPERLVSVEFMRVPLDRALRRLLAAESFVLLYDPPVMGGAVKLRRVILLGSARLAPEEGRLTPAADTAAAAHAEPDTAQLGTGLPASAEAFTPDAPLEALLVWTTHPEQQMRTAALEALTLHNEDERARQTLLAHLADPDLHLRTVALGLLGPFMTQWPGAEEMVLTALGDPAPAVRQLALLTLSEASSAQALDALHRALQDQDPGVRAHAEQLLRDSGQ